MTPEQKKQIDAILAEAHAKHPAIRGAVDILASIAQVYSHAMGHCDELAQQIHTVGYAAVTHILVAAGQLSAKDYVCDAALKIINIANGRAPDAPVPPAPPFNINLH